MYVRQFSIFRTALLGLAALILVACNSANPDNLGVTNRAAPPVPVVQPITQQQIPPTLDANGNVIAPVGGQVQNTLNAQGAAAVAPQINGQIAPQALAPTQQALVTPEIPQAPASPQIPATTVHIAPIIGATVATVRPLSRQIQAVAKTNNIGIQKTPSAAQYTMRGYFSALAENGQTTVIYVWDVIDRSGNRLHRISGQEKRQGGRPDAWSGVTPDMMQNVANKTMSNFQSWRLKRSG